MPEKLEVAYVQMNEPHVDARHGKLEKGRVLVTDPEKAQRWIAAGVAEESSKANFEKYKQSRVDLADSRENAYAELNQTEPGALWDVSTHRDVLMASKEGLQRALDAGVPLVNLGRLRTPDGLPLSQDATIDEIIEARNNLHPDMLGPLTAHERASTQGGGSHYDMPMPLNPDLREQEMRIRENERNAQSRALKAEHSVGHGSARARQAARRTEAAKAQQAEEKD